MPDGTPSRTEEITQILRDEILRGQYRAGERLPSERDIATRFETSRSTVREAYKKLEQLGIVSIQPRGARVVPVQECTLDVLGPLLDLNDAPDVGLVDEVFGVGAVLISYAAELAVEQGDATRLSGVETVLDEVLTAAPDELAQMHVPKRLGRAFAEASGNLVLLLIVNGLKTQIASPRRRFAAPSLDPKALRAIACKLRAAVRGRDAQLTGSLMRELVELRRAEARAMLAPQWHEIREGAS